MNDSGNLLYCLFLSLNTEHHKLGQNQKEKLLGAGVEVRIR